MKPILALALGALFATLPSAQAPTFGRLSLDDPAQSPRPRTAATPFSQSDGVNAVSFLPEGAFCGGNAEQTTGWQFDVMQAVTVIRMAYYDDGLDGLELPHEVGIWDPDGNLIAATNVTLPAGTGTKIDGIWRLLPIAPTVLTPGTGYIVGGYNGTHAECLSFDVVQRVHPNLAFVDATFSSINGNFERPTAFSGATNGFYGVGFQVRERVFSLSAGGLAGRLSTFEVNGASPGRSLYLLAGTSTSSHHAPIEGARVVGYAVADELGRATFRVPVPSQAQSAGLVFQAFDPGTSALSTPAMLSPSVR